VDPDTLPPEAAEAEWIFLRASDDFSLWMDRLVEALNTDLEWRDQHTRLAGLARERLDADRDRSYVLRGSDLRQAEGWLTRQSGHGAAPTREQAEYITRSRQSAARRERTLVGGPVGGLVIAAVLAVFALIQRQGAVNETRVAQSQLVANQATATPDLQLASLSATGSSMRQQLCGAPDTRW
jgi:hypothetical protein